MKRKKDCSIISTDPVIKIIESDRYTMKVHEDDFLEYCIKEGALIDSETAWQGKNELEALKPNARFYVLTAPEGFFRVTRAARALSASMPFSSHMAAVAFYTKNVSLALLGELYNKINKPAVITRTFSNRAEAECWLRSLMENDSGEWLKAS